MNEYDEQAAQEDALFPWLASDCMGDPAEELDFFDEASLFDEIEEG
jgi:hypothetical protein